MDHWTFIIAAYAVTFAGTGGLVLWAWATMRAGERRAADLRRGEGE